MSGGGRFLKRGRWSRRRREGGAKICDEDEGVERAVKPVGVGIHSDTKESICEPESRTGWGRLRVNAEGFLYVLDSEEEKSDMEVDADGVSVATKGAATFNGVDLSMEAPPVAGDGSASEDLPLGPSVVGNGAADEDMPLRPPLVAMDEAARMDLAPEVAARVKEVLANIDPLYHEFFISMYKILVPILFRP